MIPVPVLARRRHEIGEPVEKLKRREFDDAIGPRPRGLAAATGTVGDAGVQVHVVVERRAEAVQERDAAKPRAEVHAAKNCVRLMTSFVRAVNRRYNRRTRCGDYGFYPRKQGLAEP